MTLSEAIRDIVTNGNSLFQEEGKEPFKAVTETDLMSALRDRGWRLPPAGFFMGDVQSAGFKVRQGYQFKNKVRRSFSDGSTGRALSNYQTIIFS
jgi:hypothetical protein